LDETLSKFSFPNTMSNTCEQIFPLHKCKSTTPLQLNSMKIYWYALDLLALDYNIVILNSFFPCGC
jgi:hypothetical protein